MESDHSAVLRPTPLEAGWGWSVLVHAFSEQIQRLGENTEIGGEAFWTARVPIFRPGASESEELDYLLSLALPDDEWMDIGAGAGRLALPLSKVTRRVIAVDTSPTMRAALAEGAEGAHLPNVEVRDAQWPELGGSLPIVDVTLAANMLYTVEDPISFLEAMERRTRRLCVVALADRAPRTPDPEVWEALHGEALALLPGARDFITMLGALGRRFNVMTFPAPQLAVVPAAEAAAQQAWRYGLQANSSRVPRLRELFEQHFEHSGEFVRVRSGRRYTAVVSWEPPIAAASESDDKKDA